MDKSKLEEENLSFNDRLLALIEKRASNFCVGLDPDYELIKEMYATETASLDETMSKCFVTQKVVSETCRYAVAYKPNAAFWEFNPDGGASVPSLVRLTADEETILIYDGKRGDIGNTSRMYANGILGKDKYDCVTVNPLMGDDGILPFLTDMHYGAFVLCLTSNSGAAAFLEHNDLYLRIAELAAHKWNQNNNVGLVVGATRPEKAYAIRQVAPMLPLLIPGIGVQGASLDEILDAIDAKHNRRFLINGSRSIMFPKSGRIQEAAEKLYEEIHSNIY